MALTKYLDLLDTSRSFTADMLLRDVTCQQFGRNENGKSWRLGST